MTTCLILVAGGKGVRAGAPMPKQYQSVGGKPVLAHAIEHAAASEDITHILAVIGADHDALYGEMLHSVSDVAKEKLITRAYGGETRQGSTQNGLSALPEGTQRVLVHDAARPFLASSVVNALLAAVAPGIGAIPALPIPDSIKRVSGDMVTQDPNRDGLMRAQTPQAFLIDDLRKAFNAASSEAYTDEASAARQAGLEIRIVPGDEALFKITHPADFSRAEEMLVPVLSDIRVGQGFDVHAFEPGDHITLCGIEIAHTHRLKGHSDADVGLHALTDAILGAIGAGDIGDHFPPSDPQWAGAASHKFLEFAAQLVGNRGGIIAHVDITLICETPKIGPYRAAMVTAIATWLGLEETRVSVKATTTEKLGFTGRGEGIAAQAVATVRLP